MLFKKFDALYKKQVYTLTYEEGMNLSIEVCKKLYFDYAVFVSEENWGDKDLLMDAIQLCEQTKSQLLDKGLIDNMITKVDAIIPDTEDFSNYLGSYALNAAASVYELLQFIIDKDLLHVYIVGTYLIDTIDCKIEEIQSEQLSVEQIAKHPIMVEAQNFLLKKTNGHCTTGSF